MEQIGSKFHILDHSTDSLSTRVFAGTVQHALDDNHRVTVPARWRHEGLSELYAVPDPRQPFLILLAAEELQKIAADLEMAQEIPAAERRRFVRQLFARASVCPLDRQGRLVLPSDACSLLDLRGEVVLAGGGSRIEVWQPERWRQNTGREEDAFAAVADRVGL